MTSLKEKITDFVSKIKTLQSLESSLFILKHHAEKNNHQQALENLNAAYAAIKTANQNLIESIQFCLKSSESKFSAFSLVEHNLASLTENIKITQEDFLPHKEELLTLISSCAATFKAKDLIILFKDLKENKPQLSEQIILLEDLCETEF